MENTPRTQKTAKPVVAITSGDPNGIGYEILLKGLFDPHIVSICCPVIYGNLSIAKKHLSLLSEEMHDMQLNLINSVEQAKDGKVNIINCYPDDIPLHIGHSTKEGGKASYLALSKACADLKAGKVSTIVTAPINKENIQSEDFQYSGHTEYLTTLFGKEHESLMMMVSDQMRVALVCNHVTISKVPLFITEAHIIKKLTILNQTLQNDFTIRKPRIAVLALNPHAGDNGLIGTEEKEIIIPALEKAKENGIWAFGPYSADGFFGSGKYKHFDAVLAMYHDQGLIPFKSLDMNGVNYTAGLDIIRTSPDHGTAYDLAGKNQADATSFLHALYMSIDLLKTRASNHELLKNPLQSKNNDKTAE